MILGTLMLGGATAQPDTGRLDELRDQFAKGDYATVSERIEGLPAYRLRTGHYELRVEANLAVGAVSNALTSVEAWRERDPEGLPGLAMAVRVNRLLGRTNEVASLLKTLDEKGRKLNPKDLNTDDLLALGEAALDLGADPKQILDQCFLPARKKNPRERKAHLAAAGLAIEKNDFALGATLLREGRKATGDHPDLLLMMARAWAPNERERATGLAEQALRLNTNHVASLLFLAEQAMDEEDYDAATNRIARALAVNPVSSRGWALRAAVAYLLHDGAAGKAAEARALEVPPNDPAVMSLIGRKLSEKRRFVDGSARQREALALDPDYLPAKSRLGQDLLRLGEEEEAWRIVEAVHEADPYDVVAFNLMILHDQMKTFVTRTNEHFVIRMTPEEEGVYGDRVEALLESGRALLCKRYGYELEGQIVVEFFPDQGDFAIRTLGFPGGLGLLGACFGRVITMNSPGSYGAFDSNWEVTLWHEFCHAVTLGATNNRIPRWLTEGCSVNAEAASAVGDGRPVRAKHKRMLAAKGVIPLEKLSKALTSFSEPGLIDFAYFQSGQIVTWWLEEYGEEAMHDVLAALERGVPEAGAFAAAKAPIEEWWPVWTNHLAEVAADFCDDLDWTLPDDPRLGADPAGMEAFLAEHPGNLWALESLARSRMEDEDWDGAAEFAEAIRERCPEHAATYGLLALIERRRGNAAAERAALHGWVERSSSAEDACLRLLELETAAENWEGVLKVGPRQLAINPLLRIPHQALGRAYEDAGEIEKAVAAYQRLLRLGPVDVAEVHFRLGSLLKASDPAKAKRHVLRALEEAPRFRDAYSLLVELQEE